MKIILSPSKKMEIKSEDKNLDINFENKTMEILRKIQSMDIESLNKALKIKGEIGERVYNIYKNWNKLNTEMAGFVYRGSTYDGLDIDSWDDNDIAYAQDKFFILSAFYGVLNIDSKIREYRLDMNTKLKINSKTLYAYWKDEIDDFFKDKLDNDILINLASNEFSKMLNIKNINFITPVFKEKRGDEYRSVSVFSKKARGAMARYIIKNQIENREDIKKFNYDSYKYSEKLSTDREYVFIR